MKVPLFTVTFNACVSPPLKLPPLTVRVAVAPLLVTVPLPFKLAMACATPFKSKVPFTVMAELADKPATPLSFTVAPLLILVAPA